MALLLWVALYSIAYYSKGATSPIYLWSEVD